MTDYQPLWLFLQAKGEESITLSFEEIEFYTGVALKNSFLKEKKQAEMYGYRVDKIFLREKRIIFKRLKGEKHE